MGSLQIRDLPDDLYEALAARARQERRSLAARASTRAFREGPDRENHVPARRGSPRGRR